MTPNACARFEPVAWWFTRQRIGRSLRERYQASEELPRSLLTLVRKLDALEGNQYWTNARSACETKALPPARLKRYLGTMRNEDHPVIDCPHRRCARDGQDYEQRLQEQPSRVVRSDVHRTAPHTNWVEVTSRPLLDTSLPLLSS